jgi:hypothetical protein
MNDLVGILIALGLFAIAAAVGRLASAISHLGLEKHEWRELMQPLSSISAILAQIRDGLKDD